jgi:hypothetical protein
MIPRLGRRIHPVFPLDQNDTHQVAFLTLTSPVIFRDHLGLYQSNAVRDRRRAFDARLKDKMVIGILVSRR